MDGNESKKVPQFSEQRAREIAIYYLESDGSYFNQKETLAHAALGLEVAFFGVLMTVSNWPPVFVKDVNLGATYMLPAGSVINVGVIALWLLIHVFLRRQLRFARSAAIHQMAVIRVLRAWGVTTPSAQELEPSSKKIPGSSRFIRILDHFLPLCSKPVEADLDLRGEVEGIAKLFCEEMHKGTYFSMTEKLLTWGSILVIVLFGFCRLGAWLTVA